MTQPGSSRRSALAALAAAVFAAGGCASFDQLSAEVSAWGDWPGARPPGRYAFERLPSQAAHPDDAAVLEAAARDALARAGFTPAADAASADVTVQIGARVTRSDRSPWDDPLWWRWGVAYWRHPGWHGSGLAWTLRADTAGPPRTEREVALLLRDRASGTPLYEARASSDSSSSGSPAGLRALFDAALAAFPALPATNPATITVQVMP